MTFTKPTLPARVFHAEDPRITSPRLQALLDAHDTLGLIFTGRVAEQAKSAALDFPQLVRTDGSMHTATSLPDAQAAALADAMGMTLKNTLYHAERWCQEAEDCTAYYDILLTKDGCSAALKYQEHILEGWYTFLDQGDTDSQEEAQEAADDIPPLALCILTTLPPTSAHDRLHQEQTAQRLLEAHIAYDSIRKGSCREFSWKLTFPDTTPI